MHTHSPIILDVAGLTLTATDRQRLMHPLTGGVILFARNWHSREQLTTLCRDIKRVRADLLICVDHEGGRVQRFKTDGFTHLPAMRELGLMWHHAGESSNAHQEGRAALQAMNAATACGFVLASELRACGVDLSFTPVLDLDWGESSVIGDRAFHSDPRVVSVLAKSLMHGLLKAGMANCAKHFPGHGFVKADSHTDIPIDERRQEEIIQRDAWPYEVLSTVLSSVMPAHVIYPSVDARPAGFSKKWLEDILRAQMNFQGAIFSDDLSMKGAREIDGEEVSYVQAAIHALNAGCDVVLLCNQSVEGEGGSGQPIDELLEGLELAASEGKWKSRAVSEDRRLLLLSSSNIKGWDELMRDPEYIHALTLIP
jgi:beta-N-acetylhexosaminidase